MRKWGVVFAVVLATSLMSGRGKSTVDKENTEKVKETVAVVMTETQTEAHTEIESSVDVFDLEEESEKEIVTGANSSLYAKTNADCNLRAEPSEVAEIIGIISAGTEVEILAKAYSWVHIRTDNNDGYILIDFINGELGNLPTEEGIDDSNDDSNTDTSDVISAQEKSPLLLTDSIITDFEIQLANKEGQLYAELAVRAEFWSLYIDSADSYKIDVRNQRKEDDYHYQVFYLIDYYDVYKRKLKQKEAALYFHLEESSIYSSGYTIREGE